jgi:hypothetical protein
MKRTDTKSETPLYDLLEGQPPATEITPVPIDPIGYRIGRTGCPEIEDPCDAYGVGAVQDTGRWTAETGTIWRQERKEQIEAVMAARRANLGNHRAEPFGTPLAEGKPAAEEGESNG